MGVSDEADVNEIFVALNIVNGDWGKIGNKINAREYLDGKKSKLNSNKVVDLEARAKAMVKKVQEWMKTNGCPEITKVWWLKTTNQEDYKKLVPNHIWQKYPADIMIETKKCKLGISAKSSNSKNAKPPIKNPGLGTVLDTLKIQTDFDSEAKKQLEKQFSGIKFDKEWLRESKNSKFRNETIRMGKKVRLEICDSMYDELTKKENNGTLLDYILEEWIDVPRTPRYIKVWGYGQTKNYGANIIDPLETQKKLEKMTLVVEKSGFSVIIKANGKKLIGFRSKYESEQMASGLKFSVDIPARIDFI